MVKMPSASNQEDLVVMRDKSASIALVNTSNTSNEVDGADGIIAVRTSLAQIGVYPPAKLAAATPQSIAKDKRLSRIMPTSISLRHYDNLIDELRCPVCIKPLQAPIRLCASGHSVCSGCSHSLDQCPMCSRNFTQARSTALEAVAAKAEFNCTNVMHGCEERLPADLLVRHEKRCVYQIVECFMGKVWDNCSWTGSQIDWIDHCIGEHIEKMHFCPTATIEWQSTYEADPPSISGYYIFQVFGETFNMYQLWDNLQRRVSWTVICASKDPNISKQYAYEVELFSKTDPFRLSVQRHACHGERDDDIMQNGRSASFDIAEVTRFMDAYRVLHYRVKIMAISYAAPDPSVNSSSRSAIKAAKEKYFGNDQSSHSNSIASAKDGGSTSSFEEIRRSTAGVGVDSIDQDIVKTTDLKHLFAKEFSDVVRAAVSAVAVKSTATTIAAGNEDDATSSASFLKQANSVPKPPRHSLDLDKSGELKPLLEKESIPLIPPDLPVSPAPKADKVLNFAISNTE